MAIVHITTAPTAEQEWTVNDVYLVDISKIKCRIYFPQREEPFYYVLWDDIQNAPNIDAAPVMHGRWVAKTGRAMCSACADECWADSVLEYNYCPNCGAKMDL